MNKKTNEKDELRKTFEAITDELAVILANYPDAKEPAHREIFRHLIFIGLEEIDAAIDGDFERACEMGDHFEEVRDAHFEYQGQKEGGKK